VLNARSGTLRASLQASAGLSGNIAAGAISSAVPYAAIHEYGGTIDRVARVSAAHGRRLRQQAAAYKIVEPEASYLRSTLEEQMDAIKAALTDAALEALDQ
jgi:phage gpG-like protein